MRACSQSHPTSVCRARKGEDKRSVCVGETGRAFAEPVRARTNAKLAKGLVEHPWRSWRDLNPRGRFNLPTHLAGGRTRPGYATTPRTGLV